VGGAVKPREEVGMVRLCKSCGYANRGKHWFRPGHDGDAIRPEEKIVEVVCPACERAKKGIYGGVLHLEGKVLKEKDKEVLHALEKEEAVESRYNHLSRIIRVDRTGDRWKVLTASPQLAVSLGKRLKKLYGGKIRYFGNRTGHRDRVEDDNKTVTVEWKGPQEE